MVICMIGNGGYIIVYVYLCIYILIKLLLSPVGLYEFWLCFYHFSKRNFYRFNSFSTYLLFASNFFSLFFVFLLPFFSSSLLYIFILFLFSICFVARLFCYYTYCLFEIKLKLILKWLHKSEITNYLCTFLFRHHFIPYDGA